MTTTSPIYCQYMGEGEFKVARRFAKRCDEQYVIGETYCMDPIDEAQAGRDRFYHAALREIWLNLPEQYDGQFPHCDDFRKWCLIHCGFATKARIPCGSVKTAQALLPHITPNEFAIIELEGAIIVITKAKSQKMRGGMDKAERQRSYDETLAFAQSLIGVDSASLEQRAKETV